MSKQLAVVIKSQADGNQLTTLVHSHKVRSIDSGAVRPFKVGETAIFWLYPSSLHFSQYTASAYPSTIESFDAGVAVGCGAYVSVNELAQELSVLE